MPNHESPLEPLSVDAPADRLTAGERAWLVAAIVYVSIVAVAGVAAFSANVLDWLGVIG